MIGPRGVLGEMAWRRRETPSAFDLAASSSISTDSPRARSRATR